MCRCWLVAVCLAFAAPDGDGTIAWKYVTPATGGAFEHPPLRAIELGTVAPEDLKELVEYRGQRRRYAQIRYGSPGSIRVAVVLDLAADDTPDLYVDGDRDRTIRKSDLVEGDGRTWRVPVESQLMEGEQSTWTPRKLVFRYGKGAGTLAYATAGYLEGSVSIGDQQYAVRRTDADGNALFTDAVDRLWLDLDRDGQWSALAEQFLFSPVLALGDDRYALKSDPFGRRLALTRLEGTGSVRIAFTSAETASLLTAMTATLVGRDGSAFCLTGVDRDRTVPVGEYRLSSLSFTLKDLKDGPAWNYVFSDNGGRAQRVWFKVEKDASRRIEPLAEFEVDTGLPKGTTTCRPDEILTLSPRIYTRDGLLINTCYRGKENTVTSRSGPCGRTMLVGIDGKPVSTASSGFA
jgi:hypothetical protein